MSLENAQNNVPTLLSAEELRGVYKDRLDLILNKTLTVENIYTFADSALEELVVMINEILNEYKVNGALKADLELDMRAQEDDALNKLNLPNVQDILQNIIEIKNRIDQLKVFVGLNKDTTNTTLIPPQRAVTYPNGESGEGVDVKNLLPRLVTLLYILETDFDVQKEKVSITEGSTTANMMRTKPYMRVQIPDMERIVYICDEEGNATYIFDTKKLAENALKIEDIDVSDKGTLKDLIAKHPKIGIKCIQSKYWRLNIADLLSQSIPENDYGYSMADESKGESSEFEAKKKLMAFKDFEEEVKVIYPGDVAAREWYYKERKNHPNWPANPYRAYANTGWVGWSELVGNVFLDLNEFLAETKASYAKVEGSGIREWYSEEQRNHPDWPANPSRTYKDKGWTSWRELIGEKPKEFLEFASFLEEVKASYMEVDSTGIEDWYRKEQKNHLNWPSNPNRTYKDKGWTSWPELIGREPRKFLEYDDLKEEVKALYPGGGNIERWYKEEQKKHPSWPSNPNRTHKDNGWTSWSELVDVEFMEFKNFQEEVRVLYPGVNNVRKWYRKEQQSHENWPVNPYSFYKTSGWISWGELVGNK